jgi:hypothetical protein
MRGDLKTSLTVLFLAMLVVLLTQGSYHAL